MNKEKKTRGHRGPRFLSVGRRAIGYPGTSSQPIEIQFGSVVTRSERNEGTERSVGMPRRKQTKDGAEEEEKEEEEKKTKDSHARPAF